MTDEDQTSPSSASNLAAHEPASSAPLRRNDLFPLLSIIWIASCVIDDAPRRVRRALKAQVVELKRSMERYGVTMSPTPKANWDKYVWTDPSQLREVKVCEAPRAPDALRASSSAKPGVSVSAKKSASKRNPPA